MHLKEMFQRSKLPLPYPNTSVLRGNQREESRCSNVLSLPFSPSPLESGMFGTVEQLCCLSALDNVIVYLRTFIACVL